jgi:transcriptional regulator with XRE-family HTH domain
MPRGKLGALGDAAEMDLRALREAAGLTQAELAAKMEVGQGLISRIEQHRNNRIAILREVVRALGGELEIVAVIKGKRIRLAG